MTDAAFVDACFFKNFAAGDGLVIFDLLFPQGALTGVSIHFELSVKHADALSGRLMVQPANSAELLNAIANIQLRYPALSTADAELLYLAQSCLGLVYTDELPLYKACEAYGITCKRFIGCLREAVIAEVIPPADAIAFLHRVLAIHPPRRLPPSLVAEILAEWEALQDVSNPSCDVDHAELIPPLDFTA